MNTNPNSVPLRTFIRPMTWASLEQLTLMRDELAEELELVHESVVQGASKRNGYTEVERELKWRLRTGLAAPIRPRNRRNPVAARAQAGAPKGSESLAFYGRGALGKRMESEA